MSEIKKVEDEQRQPTMFDTTLDGIELFDKTVTMIAKLNGLNKTFAMDAIVKGHAMGVTNPYTAMAMFWCMNNKAEIKTDAIQKHLLDGGFIEEYFTVIEDCVGVYKYYDKDVFDSLVKEKGNSWYNAAFKDKTKFKPEQFMQLAIGAIAYKESNKELAARGREGRMPTPYDYRTTMEALHRGAGGKLKRTQYSYYFSTAKAKGLHLNGTGKDATEKNTWKDKSWMMMKRCAGKLAGIVAPGAVYSTESVHGYANPQVLDAENQRHKQKTGEHPTSTDIEDVHFEEVPVTKVDGLNKEG